MPQMKGFFNLEEKPGTDPLHPGPTVLWSHIPDSRTRSQCISAI